MEIFKIFLVMVILGAISGVCAEDTIIYVNNTHYWYQSGAFFESNNSIQDAIENMPENGIVEVTTDLKVSNGIEINKSNIIIDLKGNKLSGNYEGRGISISGNNVSLKNGVVSNFDYGIVLENAENCKISNNEVFGNTYDGIYILNSKNNDISENLVYENGVMGIVTSGIFLDGSEFNNITKNTVNNNIYNGIELLNSKNNLISGNTVFENEDNGVFVWDSKNNSIIFNELYQNENNGILTRESEFNTIESNNIFENDDSGIYSWKSFENTISKNKISKNSEGIILWNSDLNVLFKNKLLNNLKSGISIEFGTKYNTIYDNLFNNSLNVRFEDSGENYWNAPVINESNILEGEFTAGNVWYTPEGTGFSQKAMNQDSNGDTLSETYYELNSENIDNIPLAPDSVPPVVSIVSPRDNAFFNENETILVDVSVTDNSEIHSVMLELDNSYKEIMMQNGTTYSKSLDNLDYGAHTIKIYAEDAVGNINSFESRVFSISTPDSTPPEVRIISPVSKSYAEGSEVSIKVQITDESDIYSAYAKIDDYNVDLIESNGYYINILDNLEWGAHTLWIIVTDAAGNSNYNEKVTFDVNEGDITPPEVEIIEPEIGDSFEENVSVKVSATDDSGIDSVKVMLDEKVSFTLTKNSEYYTGTLTDLSYGIHTLRVYAGDNEENINSDEVIQFEIEVPDYSYTKPTTVDTQEPTETSNPENTTTDTPSNNQTGDIAPGEIENESDDGMENNTDESQNDTNPEDENNISDDESENDSPIETDDADNTDSGDTSSDDEIENNDEVAEDSGDNAGKEPTETSTDNETGDSETSDDDSSDSSSEPEDNSDTSSEGNSGEESSDSSPDESENPVA
ncbi:parallel beta-helix repeat protein [Methanococcus maripaludis]|uniref:Parallel beta-helix repeat protein n=1 Tax=Methanococcus maripaludis TaxID=39152 RepID=A0A7J9NK67_METMI|nr:NosD domain-containing protein [Methanococcus maripaludis]MBA2840679.1 parallel beta-helix repeat protein [Methanococcus maripaludis]